MKLTGFSLQLSRRSCHICLAFCQKNDRLACLQLLSPPRLNPSQMLPQDPVNRNHSYTAWPIRTLEPDSNLRFQALIRLSRVETVSTLLQHYILTPSHVREPYLLYLLTHPPESIVHLRRAPPEPATKNSKRSAAKGDKRKTKSTSSKEEIVQPPPTIIFCARPRSAAYLTYLLKSLGIKSTALHSRLTQRERLTSLSLFRSSVVPVLISTDVGSRGLDIEEVALVINWDIPSEPEEYTHRVGRTARKGRGGVAVSFVTERDEERVLKIEARISTRLVVPCLWTDPHQCVRRYEIVRNVAIRRASSRKTKRCINGQTARKHG
jgi:superfamily II DNA/RNA helicase